MNTLRTMRTPRTSGTPVAVGCLAVALVLLAGCSDTDPYLRPGMWQPTGANTLNLAAMVANPHDLISGRRTAGTPGVEATPPVTRYWAGKTATLPSTSSQADGTGQARPDAGAPPGGN